MNSWINCTIFKYNKILDCSINRKTKYEILIFLFELLDSFKKYFFYVFLRKFFASVLDIYIIFVQNLLRNIFNNIFI